MNRSIALVLMFLALPAMAQGATTPSPATGAVGSATPLTPPPDDRAKQWLGLLDDQNYADAYKQMGASAQGKLAVTAWTQQMGSRRGPLGAMSNRTIKSISLSHTVPGMRDGQYATVQFDSSFAHKGAARETVTLTSDKGAWSVIAYTVD